MVHRRRRGGEGKEGKEEVSELKARCRTSSEVTEAGPASSRRLAGNGRRIESRGVSI
jgi:hypothetical protein